MDEEIWEILAQVLPIIRDNPYTIRGHDISQKELSTVKQQGEIPFELLALVSWDHCFEACHDQFGITLEEAVKARQYVTEVARRDEEERKQLMDAFPYVVEEWEDYEGTTDWM